MKHDKFASINNERKIGRGILILVAVIALCIVGVAGAYQLRSQSNNVYMDVQQVPFEQSV